MPRRPHLTPRSPGLAVLRRPSLLGAAGAVACTVLAGCGSDVVHVDGFTTAAGTHGACVQLLDRLPERVAGQTQRRTSGSAYAAAWGDPAIVLRCGVGLPSHLAGEPCLTTNGIDWRIPSSQIDDSSRDVVMLLAKRRPRLEVTVPAHYRPNGPSEAMVDLGAVIRMRTTVLGHCH